MPGGTCAAVVACCALRGACYRLARTCSAAAASGNVRKMAVVSSSSCAAVGHAEAPSGDRPAGERARDLMAERLDCASRRVLLQSTAARPAHSTAAGERCALAAVAESRTPCAESATRTLRPAGARRLVGMPRKIRHTPLRFDVTSCEGSDSEYSPERGPVSLTDRCGDGIPVTSDRLRSRGARTACTASFVAVHCSKRQLVVIVVSLLSVGQTELDWSLVCLRSVRFQLRARLPSRIEHCVDRVCGRNLLMQSKYPR